MEFENKWIHFKGTKLLLDANNGIDSTPPEIDWDYCYYPFYRYRNVNKENTYSKYMRFRYLLGIYYPFYPLVVFLLSQFSISTSIFFHSLNFQIFSGITLQFSTFLHQFHILLFISLT